jgi:hypothetical protein
VEKLDEVSTGRNGVECETTIDTGANRSYVGELFRRDELDDGVREWLIGEAIENRSGDRRVRRYCVTMRDYMNGVMAFTRWSKQRKAKQYHGLIHVHRTHQRDSSGTPLVGFISS